MTSLNIQGHNPRHWTSNQRDNQMKRDVFLDVTINAHRDFSFTNSNCRQSGSVSFCFTEMKRNGQLLLNAVWGFWVQFSVSFDTRDSMAHWPPAFASIYRGTSGTSGGMSLLESPLQLRRGIIWDKTAAAAKHLRFRSFPANFVRSWSLVLIINCDN